MSFRKESRSEISLELTQIDYAELKGLYAWHKANFEKELEDIKRALILSYCQKHRLHPAEPSNAESLSDEDIKTLRKAVGMEDFLNDKTYQHLLE